VNLACPNNPARVVGLKDQRLKLAFQFFSEPVIGRGAAKDQLQNFMVISRFNRFSQFRHVDLIFDS